MNEINLLEGPIIEPKSKTIKKIVLFLHGYGADGSDLINIANEWIDILPDTAFYSPNAPFICDVNPTGFQWFKLLERNEVELKEGLNECVPYLDKFINHILEENKLEISDLAVFGFSQGTILALYHLLKRKKSCAGIIGCSGILYQDKEQKNYNSDIPIFLYHGKKDLVIDFESSLKAKEKLDSQGFKVDCFIQEGLEHGIDRKGIQMGQRFLKDVLKV